MAEEGTGAAIYTYAADGAEISCDTPDPPRRFDNMIFNDAYFAQVDQCMRGAPELGGRHMSEEGHVCNVVGAERVVYVRDDDTLEYFSAGWWPTCKQYETYRCTSGINYQTVVNVTDGLEVTWRVFVPAGGDPLEIWDVRVANLQDKPRTVSIVTELPMELDGVDLFGGFLYRRASYVPESNGVFVRQDGERHRVIDFPLHNGFVLSDREVVSWCTSRDGFIGSSGSLARPEALGHELIPQIPASRYTPTGSLQVKCALPPRGHADTRFLVGACDGPERMRVMAERYLTGNIGQCPVFDATATASRADFGAVQVSLPDERMEPRFNNWIKQQIRCGAVHCRWGYKGYRDIVQQAQGILTQDAALSRAIILKACAHQYADGFALRGWHPIDPMRYADSAQWLVATVTEYLKETGDMALLEEAVPFYDEGAADVREHIMRAMRRLRADRGSHGLCKIFFGDWNDSLTGPGRRGEGESVWLSMSFCRCCLLLEELAAKMGDAEMAATMRSWREEMRTSINRDAWDGEWYLCALDDDGQPVGTSSASQGRIFLNTQSWAQLGRVCDDERWEKAWASTRAHLDTGWGLRLNWPSYFTPEYNVGRMSYMRPGICENGSVYTHGNAFMLMALLERGMADEALRLLEDMDPLNAARPMVNQPNLYSNGFLGPDAEEGPGRMEHVWATGSAVWLDLAVVEYFLGARRTYDGIVIRPCMPGAWRQASVRRVFRGTTYDITLANPEGLSNPSVERITVDGSDHPVDGPLPLDSKSHVVNAVLGPRAAR